MTLPKVLAIGAHPDDVELGCGGTITRHIRAGGQVTILIMTDGLSGPGKVKMRRAEAAAAAAVLQADVIFGGLGDGELSAGIKTVSVIEDVLDEVRPYIIYTHAEDDSHQDHRNTASAVLSAARNYATLLHFQSPSTRTFNPDAFVALEDADLDTKIEALEEHASQVAHSARVDLLTVRATAQYWGTKARTPMAEGFEVTRSLFNPTAQGLVIGERRAGSGAWTGDDRRIEGH